MQLQFVYGNPKKVSKKVKKVRKLKPKQAVLTRRTKKKLASKLKTNKNKTNEEAHLAKRKKAKKHKKAKVTIKAKKHHRKVKKHSKKAKKSVSHGRKIKKHKKSKNPERYKLSAKNIRTGEKIKDKWTKAIRTPGEIAYQTASARKVKAAGKMIKEYAKNKPKKMRKKAKKLGDKLNRAGNKILAIQAAKRTERKIARHDLKQTRSDLKTAGFKVRAKHQVGATLAKRKKVKKHKSKSKKRNPIISSGGNMIDMAKRAVTGGMDKYELGALALGGALYPITAAGLAKFLPTVYSKVAAMNIPGGAGVGVNFLIGAAAYAVGEKMNQKSLQSVGKGLIAAAAVGVAAVAGQYIAKQANLIPGTAPLASLPEGYGTADFGTADFGGVDFTMNGVNYSAGQEQLNGADFGAVDYTMDGLPEGMGEGQMG